MPAVRKSASISSKNLTGTSLTVVNTQYDGYSLFYGNCSKFIVKKGLSDSLKLKSIREIQLQN